MKSILIKEIDQLTSKLHKNRIVSEYLIYIMFNNTITACYSEFGEEAKTLRVKSILGSNFDSNEVTENIIKEVSFKELTK